jgi:hypothetical protein
MKYYLHEISTTDSLSGHNMSMIVAMAPDVGSKCAP